MNATKPARFPFSAVVGHDDGKLALLLAAIDPAIGGVLLRGQKGSAKTTLARGLATLLPGDAPFVDLPLGATEDRLIGTLDLGALLTGERRSLQPGPLSYTHHRSHETDH
jgi:Mg-chelatase subunit ChlI